MKLNKLKRKAVLLMILPLTLVSAAAYSTEVDEGEITGCTDYFEVKIFGFRILRKYNKDCFSNPDGRWDWFELS